MKTRRPSLIASRRPVPPAQPRRREASEPMPRNRLRSQPAQRRWRRTRQLAPGVADQARQVVLEIPAQVVQQPVDVGGQLRIAVDARCGLRRPAPAESSAGLAASTDTRRSAFLAARPRHRTTSSSPAGVMAMQTADGRGDRKSYCGQPRSRVRSGSAGMRLQALHRHRLGGDDMVGDENDALHPPGARRALPGCGSISATVARPLQARHHSAPERRSRHRCRPRRTRILNSPSPAPPRAP